MASSDKHIHLISFDVPFPPSYGGVIDVFYKLKALSENNVKVTLHCFRYGRPESNELSRYCDQVIYYPRKSFVSFFTDGKPWIVSSRMSEALVQNLLRDHDPILFEGLHTCGILNDPRLRNRKRIVRTHNIEHDYYHNLAEAERSILKKLYFREESRRLKKFEMELASATAVAAISPSDQNHFTAIQPNTFYLPAFHPNDAPSISTGTGNFALYHGNLGVGENDKAALYLVNEVFRDSDIPLVIAGSNPTEALSSAVQHRQNIRLIRDIPTEEVMQLVRDAQVHVLPTFQPTGIKLKLLSALFNGRHVVVNREMVENTGLEPLCHVAADAESMRAIVGKLMQKEFGKEEYTRREKILNSAFSNRTGASILIEKIFA